MLTKRLRRQLQWQLTREEISEKVFDGIQKPEYSFYPSIVEWAANTEDTAPEFDVAGAQKVLEDAGYTKNSDGMYITGLTLDVFEGSGYPDTAKLIKATLEEVGIGVEVQVSEYNAWSQKVSVDRDFSILLMGGFMGPDPSALTNRIGTGKGANYGSYSNPEVDNLLKQGAATIDQNERAEYYSKKRRKFLAEDLPYLNIVSFAGPEGSSANFKNLPLWSRKGDGADYSQ